MSTKAKQTALEWVEQNEKLVKDVHMKIWGYAEVGLQEMKTAKLMTDILRKEGFKVEKGVAGMPSAFVATYGTGKPVIGVMGELDALPGISQKAVPYREALVEGAAGHGCGHNGYATAALAGSIAAKVAMKEHKIPGTLKCFGCPAEETLVGKVYMVRDGVFDGIDACLGHHPASSNGVNLGSGNAMNSMKFEFFGVASHAAGSPERGISAMDGIELMNIGVNYLREHVVQEARMHYVVEDGGHEPNVVPPYARSWYYVRAPTRELVNEYYERVLKIADGADLMAGTTHKVQFLTGVHNGLPNRPLAECVVANMKEIGAPTYNDEELVFAKEVSKSISREAKMTNLSRSPIPNAMDLMDIDLDTNIYEPYGEERKGGGGSSDVADVAWNTPTQQFGTVYTVVSSPGHSWQNVACNGTSIGQKGSVFASKVMAYSVLDLLTKPDLVKRAKEDWAERMKGHKYVSPLPPDLKPPLDQLPPMRE
ncbi:amidohydrolase [miscellaneous Crenarchaeota group-15 archaeon DG-45]|uniref:Amidohydrolase n=1 Tax=miscellaneous Crenarchaeota group-15 archaeon DG-45 TaxID=1685127 RepID=A0A0M0BPG2_9ARCH|nr:MAG: amidohydrolase [miscellaneous Crenarchaeota group-15 archaeon DG-45]